MVDSDNTKYAYIRKSEINMERKTLLIIGAGERLGRTVASTFLTKGFNVLLVGRSLSKLKKLKAQLANGSNQVNVYPADVADSDKLARQLEIIKRDNNKIDVMLYNAASINNRNILDEFESDIIYDFKVNVLGLLTAVKHLEDYLKKSNGTILVTGGGIAIHPKPDYASLSITSAGLRSMVRCLSSTLRNHGVYVGIILVNGSIDEKCPLRNPQNIADQFWKLNKEKRTIEILL